MGGDGFSMLDADSAPLDAAKSNHIDFQMGNPFNSRDCLGILDAYRRTPSREDCLGLSEGKAEFREN